LDDLHGVISPGQLSSYYRSAYLVAETLLHLVRTDAGALHGSARDKTVQLGGLVVHAIVDMNNIDLRAILATATLAAGVVSAGTY